MPLDESSAPVPRRFLPADEARDLAYDVDAAGIIVGMAVIMVRTGRINVGTPVIIVRTG